MRDYDQIIQTLKEGKKVVQNFTCKKAPQIQAHIIITPEKDDICKLTGYPIDINTGQKIANTTKKVLSHKPIAHAELEIHALCGMVEAAYLKKVSASVTVEKPKPVPDSDHFFSNALKKCQELQDHSIPIPSWGPSTRKQNINYFLHSIVPRMDLCGKDITTEDIEKIAVSLTERAFNNGRTKYCADGSKNSKAINTSKNTVRERMRDAQRIYDWVRNTYPEFDLPKVDFAVIAKTKVYHPEQLRVLSTEIYIKSAAIAWHLILEEDVFLANGAYLMLRNGPRTAEAAAPLLNEFDLFDDSPYGVYHIDHQIKGGKRVKYTKTTAGDRPIPITSDTRYLIEHHRARLLSFGYSVEEIDTMPFVPNLNDLTGHINPSLLSALCVDIFRAAGATPEYLEQIQEQMYKNPDKDADGKEVFDLSAYVARRNFISFASNVTTISNADLCVVIGHEENRKLRERLRTQDRMIELAQKLEHIVLNPEYSTSPTVVPMSLQDAVNLHLQGCTQYTFTATEEDMVLHIDTICKEPGEAIKCILSGHAEDLHRRTPLDTPEKRIGREIMGKWPDAETIRNWIAEVQNMDLSRFASYRSKATGPKKAEVESHG